MKIYVTLLIISFSLFGKAQEEIEDCITDWSSLDQEIFVDKYYSINERLGRILNKWYLAEKEKNPVKKLIAIQSFGGQQSFEREMFDAKYKQKYTTIYNQLDKKCHYDEKMKNLIEKFSAKWQCGRSFEEQSLVKAENYLAIPGFKKMPDCESYKCLGSKEAISFNMKNHWTITIDPDQDADIGVRFLSDKRLSCRFKLLDEENKESKAHHCAMVLSKKMEDTLFSMHKAEKSWSLMPCFQGPYSQDWSSGKLILVPKNSGLLLMDNEEVKFFEDL